MLYVLSINDNVIIRTMHVDNIIDYLAMHYWFYDWSIGNIYYKEKIITHTIDKIQIVEL